MVLFFSALFGTLGMFK